MILSKFRHGTSEPDNDDELDVTLDGELAGLPLRRSDIHTRAIFKLVRAKTAEWEPVGPDGAKSPADQRSVPTADVIPGVLAVPLEDEDNTNLNFAKWRRSLRSRSFLWSTTRAHGLPTRRPRS